MSTKKFKAISPIVATILLVVVAVVMITIILSFGKDFSNKSLTKANSFLSATTESDKQSFIRFVNAQNGLYTFDYYAPNTGDINFTVVGYSLLGYNDYIPLEPEYTVNNIGKFMLPLGIINEDQTTIALLTSDGSYLTFNNVKNTNRGPGNCPDGFVPVPGNYLYGTQEGFCVAKYEMKVDQNGDGLGDVNTDCQYSTYGTWDNAKATCGYTLSGRTIVSSASGYPLVDINQTDSQLACTSIGGHLITNDEWMTIARNIEIVPSNWSSGIVGTGYIYSGHNDSSPYAALAGDTNNNNGYYLTGQSSGNQRRTLTLTNGQVIWDLSGNVSEWYDNTIQRKDQPDGFNNSDDNENNSGFAYFDYSKGGGQSQYLKYTDLGNTTLEYKDLFLLNGAYNASTNGIGRAYVYSLRNDISATVYAFLRGGFWSNATHAGVLYLNAYRTPSYTDYYIGFRCVVVPE